MEIVRIGARGREEIDAFLTERWYTLQMVVHGEVVDLGAAEGCYAREGGELSGAITWRIGQGEMEILSLDSVRENRGVGTALLDRAVEEARRAGCSRIVLTTTNDALNALRFYQKRGFDIAGIRRNALDRSRQLKPEIPLTGIDGIPLRHEIELERLV
ncbi:MAG: GNAT family N-acetyltransferase [Oscillospiraceae bacterium]|nr:GNAT family N-acetyltransferase [Oscillospiraceae bacterium]